MKNNKNKTALISLSLKLKRLYIYLLFAGLLLSCEEFVEVDAPRNEIVRGGVFNNDATAISTISGIYSNMINVTSASFTNSAMEEFTGVYSDELFSVSDNVDNQAFATNSLQPGNNLLPSVFWGNAYNYLLNANSILEGLAISENVTDSVRSQLESEAKFIRAFCHFYLVNLFGPVPLATTTDVESNNVAFRRSEIEVYEQIIQDLTEAEALIATDYSFSGGERVRPNQGAVTALLARVYLYTGQWDKAEQAASTVINNASMYTLEDDLSNVFRASSTEAIWQLKPVGDNLFPPQIQRFVLTEPPATFGRSVAFTNDFYNAFESGDERRDNWIGVLVDGVDTYYYPFKYQNTTTSLAEYSVVLRLAEQYLIRAEARAQLGDLTNAINDIDALRGRANLPLLAVTNPSVSQSDLLLAIEQERRSELFAEWAHRWLDLKRTDRANAVLGSIKPEWDPTDVLFPIPENEILENPNLLPQNQGY